MVNKLSRFHRSAGLNENPPTTSSGRSSPSPSLGSSPAPSKHFEFPSGVFLGQPVAYPSPHLPPYPSPTMIQPIAQLRQPYIVTLVTSQVNLPASSSGCFNATFTPGDVDQHKEAKPWEEELGARRHPNPIGGHLCSISVYIINIISSSPSLLWSSTSPSPSSSSSSVLHHLYSVQGPSAARRPCKLPKEAKSFRLSLCDGKPWTTPRVQS